MVYFQIYPNMGKFWRVMQWKMPVYVMAIWSIFWPFGIFYGTLVYVFCGHLVHFPRSGILSHVKSGNPGRGGDFTARALKKFVHFGHVTKNSLLIWNKCTIT
jgi:hypothetical protein